MISGRLRVPFVPTPEPIVRQMLALADVKPGDHVYDLGAGDGRILSSAVREFGATAVGVELDASRCIEILERLKRERIEDSVRLIRGDFMVTNLADADVVTLYLLSSANSEIRPKLESQLRKGARVVSHDFPIKGWTPFRVVNFWDHHNLHTVYVYKIPHSVPNAITKIPP